MRGHERVVGRWLRTASDRGVLSCRFDADGRYSFAIVGRDVTEQGQYRLVSRPSEVAAGAEVTALLLRPDEGAETAIVLELRDGGMYLDGQRWWPVGKGAQLPAR